ncbi:hypothetical protein JTB14_006805 [Gonioctena quinquepunctata]|nr:hypothetical protein JTB14_006805 [Gonioctena quinquepunctata]
MFPPSRVNTPAQTYHNYILLVNHFMDGIAGRLANEVSRSGKFYSSNECLQEAEQCEEVVSRMVHETRYDALISAIWRVETREEVPHRGEGRGENRSETRAYHRNECRRPRNFFCYHCGKEGAPCSSNSQHSSDQPKS